MAAKRFSDQFESSSDQQNEKRRRTGPRLATVIQEVIAGNFLQNFCSALEPMIRRVVQEEVEHGLRRSMRSLSRSNSLRIQAVEPSRLKLCFSDRLSLPIFTASKIVDLEKNPLQIILLETRGDRMIQASLPYPIKVEIVVLDGDFPQGDGEAWTSEEFDKNIVRERTGKRPLLTGESHVTLRDGAVALSDFEFTDNSSWIRCRKFRLGARVVQRSCGGVQIQEAMSEAFVVKDHRGELYKKHHPPMLDDEVWRLEKIGKDGAFHRKLAAEGIHTVQDFLKVSVVEQPKLRTILGVGMSEKMWDVTLKHARDCVLGSKLYVYGGSSYTIILNPICEIVKVVVNGQTYSKQYLSSLNSGYVENMVKSAYANWNSLQEVDGQLSQTPLLTQGDLVDQYPNNNQTIPRSFQQHAFFTDEATSLHIAQADQCTDNWVETPAFINTAVDSGVRYTFPDSPSDGELSPFSRGI
ncbi:protein SAR DEFICIENT 1 [Apium graveolens]|uniref:Calmodulin-binding protein n=1 Tax=Apium graveolens TaxID=4045 RepID=A0A6L5B7P0_APIGR|nr:hypothetical protein AG4045_016320 [Apium graveolens]